MVTRLCLIAALFGTAAAASATAADPTLEELVSAPDKYAGQTVTLNKVKTFGGVHRDKDGTSSVHLVSAAGKVDFGVKGGTRFTLSTAVGDQLTKATGTGFKLNTPMQVTCKVKADGNKYVCEITRISVYNKNGTTVMRSFGD
jgi:hypothetical protein